MVILSFTSSRAKSEIAKKAEAISVYSDSSYPQELNSDLNCWNLPPISSCGALITDSIAAASHERVPFENSTRLSMGYVPSYLLANKRVAATPTESSLGT